MSAKLKIRNVKVMRKTKKRVGISNWKCCTPTDNAVEGIQEAGKELGDFFDKLKNEEIAEKLVRAIRCKNKKAVENLLPEDCNVVCFFNQGNFSCVRISCVFGKCCDVRITFDICVSNGTCKLC